jgi:hypothetical protein
MRAAVVRTVSIIVTTIAALVLLVPTASANVAGVYPSDKIYVQSAIDPVVWPVRDMAELLDDNSPLDLVYVSACPTSNQCIKVVHADLPESPIYTTSRTRMFALNGMSHSAIIEVNPDWARMSSGYRKKTLIHELGHAVGLNHVDRVGSIMVTYNTTDYTPDSGDYKELNRLY